jgi:hypothetical protein
MAQPTGCRWQVFMGLVVVGAVVIGTVSVRVSRPVMDLLWLEVVWALASLYHIGPWLEEWWQSLVADECARRSRDVSERDGRQEPIPPNPARAASPDGPASP